MTTSDRTERPVRRTVKRASAVAALSLAAIVLAGCTSSNGSMTDQSGGNGIPAMPAPEQGIDKGELSDGAVINADRQIISTGSLALTSSDPIGTADEVADAVTAAGGRIDSRTDAPASGQSMASASLVVRIPSTDLDTVLDDLKALGTVTGSSVNQTDVTTQAADLDARIEALNTSIDRLLALMAEATTTSDLIEIESTLSQRQAELDGLTAQREVMSDQVDFASVDVTISTPGEVAGAAPGDFWGGIVVGVQALAAFFGGLLVVLGVVLPWLVVLAVLAAIVWMLVRLIRSRRPVQQPAAAPAMPAGQPYVPPQPSAPPQASAPSAPEDASGQEDR